MISPSNSPLPSISVCTTRNQHPKQLPIHKGDLPESHSSHFKNYCCPTPFLMCSIPPLFFIYLVLPQHLLAPPLILVFLTHHTGICKDCYRTIFILKSCASDRRKQAEDKSQCSKARDMIKTRANFFPTLLFTTLQQWQHCLKYADTHKNTQKILGRAMEKVTCQRLKFTTFDSDVSCFSVSKRGSNPGKLFMRKT